MKKNLKKFFFWKRNVKIYLNKHKQCKKSKKSAAKFKFKLIFDNKLRVSSFDAFFERGAATTAAAAAASSVASARRRATSRHTEIEFPIKETCSPHTFEEEEKEEEEEEEEKK